MSDIDVIERGLRNGYASVGNVVLNSAWELSVVEKRLIYLLISKIGHSGTFDINAWYSCSAKEYALLADIEVKNAIEMLQEAANTLFERHITFVDHKSKERCRWIHRVRYEKETQEIFIKWSDGIEEFISNLSGNFTRILNENTFKLTSCYSSRLYDLLEQHRFRGNSGKLTVFLQDIYFSWCVPDSCKVFPEFNRAILKPAIAELKKKEIAIVEVEYIKRERSVIGLVITFTLNKIERKK